MSCYLLFKRSRWIALSALVWVVGCDNAVNVMEQSGVIAVIDNAQNQANASQISNPANGAVIQQASQATLEVSSCGQTTSTLLLPPH